MKASERRRACADVRRRVLAVLGVAVLATWAAAAGGQAVASASEQSVKAAYLYRFAAYVEWPEGAFAAPGTPLTIGVYGSESLADELRQVTAGRTVHGRDIMVRRIGDDQSLDGVHILFASEAAGEQLDRLAAEASRHSTLMVTDVGDALDRGSVINFRAVDQRIRFEVSLEAADASRLRLSSRLLAVAEHVRPRSR